MSDVDWVKAAATDDAVVVELLLRLRHATPSTREPPPPLAPPLEWSVRQRRSKPIPLANKKPTPRSSPTTPLSWSGATSVSGGGGGDGVEESSRPPPRLPEATRSKVAATSETTTSKRSRKKKTLAELKEEEVLLLKERRHLKRELATLRVTLEKQRATNESLKRLKLDVESQSSVEKVAVAAFVEAIPNQTQQKIVVSCDPIPSTLPPDVRIDDHHHATQPPSTPNGTSQLQQEVINQGNEFVIPDLNQPLEEDDFNSEVLHRVS